MYQNVSDLTFVRCAKMCCITCLTLLKTFVRVYILQNKHRIIEIWQNICFKKIIYVSCFSGFEIYLKLNSNWLKTTCLEIKWISDFSKIIDRYINLWNKPTKSFFPHYILRYFSFFLFFRTCPHTCVYVIFQNINVLSLNLSLMFKTYIV